MTPRSVYASPTLILAATCWWTPYSLKQTKTSIISAKGMAVRSPASRLSTISFHQPILVVKETVMIQKNAKITLRCVRRKTSDATCTRQQTATLLSRASRMTWTSVRQNVLDTTHTNKSQHATNQTANSLNISFQTRPSLVASNTLAVMSLQTSRTNRRNTIRTCVPV